MGWKEKFFISKYEIIFGYPFESCTHGLDCERRRVVLGPLFLNFGSYSRPKFGTKWNYGLERKILHFEYEIIFGYPFESCTLVLIVSEDV
jgi:hypothetical protein